MKRLKSQRIKKCRNFNRIVTALNYVNDNLIHDLTEALLEDKINRDEFIKISDDINAYILNNVLKSILNKSIIIELKGRVWVIYDYCGNPYPMKDRVIKFYNSNRIRLRFVLDNNKLKLVEYKGKFGLFNYD